MTGHTRAVVWLWLLTADVGGVWYAAVMGRPRALFLFLLAGTGALAMLHRAVYRARDDRMPPIPDRTETPR